MRSNQLKQPINRLRNPIIHLLAMVSVGLACGGLLIPWIHLLIFRSTDPFANDMPLLLQSTVFLGSLVGVYTFRCSTFGALAISAGTTLGLIAWMKIDGRAEYPVSSFVAILLHGFIPSALGSAFGYFILSRRKPHGVEIK